jgi:hypothetical protein
MLYSSSNQLRSFRRNPAQNPEILLKIGTLCCAHVINKIGYRRLQED